MIKRFYWEYSLFFKFPWFKGNAKIFAILLSQYKNTIQTFMDNAIFLVLKLLSFIICLLYRAFIICMLVDMNLCSSILFVGNSNEHLKRLQKKLKNLFRQTIKVLLETIRFKALFSSFYLWRWIILYMQNWQKLWDQVWYLKIIELRDFFTFKNA